MSAIKAILGWVFRNAFLFVLIMAALMAHAAWLRGPAADQAHASVIASEIASIENTMSDAATIRNVAETKATSAAIELARFQDSLRGASIEKLKRKKSRTEVAIAEVRKTLPSDFEVTRQVLARDTESLMQTTLAEIDLARLERQLALVDESIAIARGNGPALARINDLSSQLAVATKTLKRLEQKCSIATKDRRAFDNKWSAERFILRVLGERRKLVAAEAKACRARDRAKSAQQEFKSGIASARESLEEGAARINTTVSANLAALEELERNGNERRAQLNAQINAAKERPGSFVDRYQLFEKARSALLILLAIILTPFLIRTLFYYVLARLAERRAAIRISAPGNRGAPLQPSGPSRISLSITLEEGQELLVRQDYLQTSPIEAKKATRWLLDYRHPLSSLASGLFFLTRLRGGGSTTVSAVKDPFAELARIDLPRGASCVLHPRALVALVQPIGQTMRITSHWRLLSLNAWLTMQLRFIVFHGPGSLVVKGGRGVRVEPAAAGRIFGQDQLVGFSADLAYSVTRTETFMPYLLGREQLFKDKVEQGAGVVIIEEAPLAGRKGGEVRRGLEGVFDAGLKAFGL
jgi:uncharacterized protein (AIM24 family)